MHVNDASRRQPSGERSPTHSQDTAIESALLALLLDLLPVPLTVEELRRELSGAAEDFERDDAIERAIRDLAGAGLLHRHGPFVLPTRAALRFDQITGEAA